MMKSILISCTLLAVMALAACNSNRTQTEADREAIYVEDGDTLNPTEGDGEGTSGKKYMETTSSDSTEVIEQ